MYIIYDASGRKEGVSNRNFFILKSNLGSSNLFNFFKSIIFNLEFCLGNPTS